MPLPIRSWAVFGENLSARNLGYADTSISAEFRLFAGCVDLVRFHHFCGVLALPFNCGDYKFPKLMHELCYKCIPFSFKVAQQLIHFLNQLARNRENASLV